MKNKKNIYFLIPAVLLIWGILGYRIYASLGPSEKVTEVFASTTQFKPAPLAEQVKYELTLDYRDPFLGTIYQKKKKVIRKKVQPKKDIQAFPKIQYKGLVSSNKKESVYLIKVNGKQHFFKKNMTKDEVKLVRGNDKEVRLKFQQQTQTFLIEK